MRHCRESLSGPRTVNPFPTKRWMVEQTMDTRAPYPSSECPCPLVLIRAWSEGIGPILSPRSVERKTGRPRLSDDPSHVDFVPFDCTAAQAFEC